MFYVSWLHHATAAAALFLQVPQLGALPRCATAAACCCAGLTALGKFGLKGVGAGFGALTAGAGILTAGAKKMQVSHAATQGEPHAHSACFLSSTGR